MLRVEVEQQLLQPIEQQKRLVVAVDLHFDLALRPHAAEVRHDGLEQYLSRFDEQRVEVGRPDAQAEIGGVFEDFVHAVHPNQVGGAAIEWTRKSKRSSEVSATR